MCDDDFCKTFTELTERLDMFFHKKIRSAHINENIEEIKMDLLQSTALTVLEKLRQEKYNDYNLSALIWIKAQDVWYDYIVSREKASLSINTAGEDIDKITTDMDPFAFFEQNHVIESLYSAVPTETWNVAIMHAEGTLYKEIADHFHTTEAAIKMKMSRLRNKFGPERPY
jgi:DNA-directed RNA polymerase specialized sigma24 family protein